MPFPKKINNSNISKYELKSDTACRIVGLGRESEMNKGYFRRYPPPGRLICFIFKHGKFANSCCNCSSSDGDRCGSSYHQSMHGELVPGNLINRSIATSRIRYTTINRSLRRCLSRN